MLQSRTVAPGLALLAFVSGLTLGCDGRDDGDAPRECLSTADCGEDEVCEVKALDEKGTCRSTEDGSARGDDGAEPEQGRTTTSPDLGASG